ncbi:MULTISPECIES: DUF2254 domain-containing protein [unclassified Pantoea]|uniref:DUF2254 domain-containing protein n=1 Tax=unclassified Pantoea TaxID=2630326 RepID=UPI00141A0487|nr:MULTISPECIES: DUF2254 domain-containing protein [unclassified Pantoea]NIE72375.1 DUF2254 domain-containing protein [Pantoea sp. Acro-807]
MSKTQWLLRQLTKQLWFRSSLFAVLAVITALVAIAVKPFIPASVSGLIGSEAVDEILAILASSMLAVTTFSLNIMVTAYNSASSSVTPRATSLLMEDRTTQNVLATFIGSFLYSLVGIIALGMGAYGTQGRVVLFFVTLLVIAMIVITLLRWIQHLANFGSLGETSQRVEQATRAALTERLQNPCMGGSAWQGDLPAAARPHPLLPESIGYLQHIDLQRLNDRADAQQVHLYLAAQPGSFVHPGSPLLWCTQPMSEEDQHHLKSAFTIGEQRSYEQDPRFGLCVLAEIASRALSPAVNDPGTAIDIIGRAVRLFGHPVPPASDEVAWPRIFIRPAQISDMFDDVFTAIGRDGAGLAEVQIRLQKSLQALALIAPHRYAADAQRHSRLALSRANMAMSCAADKTAVERAAIWALPEKISCD